MKIEDNNENSKNKRLKTRIVDKMRRFLDEHKEKEKPQSTESLETYIKVSRTKSPDSIPVNW